jgi:acetate kinase
MISTRFIIGTGLKKCMPVTRPGSHEADAIRVTEIEDVLVASTMGFSPLDGLPMGTRPGQLDPGVLLYLMEQKGMGAQAISDLLYKESGLKGLSGISNDMRDLEASDDPRARQAIDYFVFRVRREIGGMAAVLEGIDAIVFCGGIGENSRMVREAVLETMEWIGLDLDLDLDRNRANADVISSDRSGVRVFVIRTDEELMIARHTAELLASRAQAVNRVAYSAGAW